MTISIGFRDKEEGGRELASLDSKKIAEWLGVSERLVKAAMESGCKSVEEIEDWLDDL